jgi:hypothetical protein
MSNIANLNGYVSQRVTEMYWNHDDQFPATIVVQNMPIMKALCICPKTLPRLVSDVMSLGM